MGGSLAEASRVEERTPEGRVLSHLGRVGKGVTLVARVASFCRIQVLPTLRYLAVPTVVRQLHCRPIPVPLVTSMPATPSEIGSGLR